MQLAGFLGAVALALLLGGCRDADVGANVSASCAFVVDYDGHRYVGAAAQVGPVEGDPLGVATQPGCRDTPDGETPDDAEVEVVEIEAVSSEVALTIRGRHDSVLIREDVDFDRLPAELALLLRAPRCEGLEPIRISGRWLGILGADGQTEVDLKPPYDVRINVTQSSSVRYARAELSVRVPADLGRPLVRSDIESSLWEGGTLSATVSCDGGRFVATAIDASPPAG